MSHPDPKSPRDWLLARHAPATPRLDVLRGRALPDGGAAPSPRLDSWRDLLRELFRPHLTAWRALALVWLGLIVFNFTFGRSPQPESTTPPPPEAVAAWLAQLKSNETFAQIDRHP